jgi:hypothetical protein
LRGLYCVKKTRDERRFFEQQRRERPDLYKRD